MNRKLSYLALVGIIFSGTSLDAHFDLSCKTSRIKKPEGSLLHNFLYDTVALQYEFFSLETFKLLLIFGSLYGVSRLIDSRVHDCFYCAETHKNTGYMSHALNRAMKGVPIAVALGYSACMFNPWSEHLSTSARVFASGLVPLELIKKLFKEVLEYDYCLRPSCEFFDHKKRYYGGFPSGHMAFMAYEATYLTLEYGWKVGVPIGILAAGVFAGSLDGNRHFLSQLVAGTGLGIAYGIAAYRVMNCYYCDNVCCDFVAEPNFVGLQASCSY